jgi:hypothetical protein
MTSNSAEYGGGIYAGGDDFGDDPEVIVTNCTMNSHSAQHGGAVYAERYSAVIATECTMTSNFAVQYGGAVFSSGDATLTATDCSMTSNSAFLGGAVAVGSDSSQGEGLTTLAHCVLTSNSASSGGAALIVRKSGFADLVNSVFQSNWVLAWTQHADGIGIVNLHGQVQCDANVGCLPVCTLCPGEEVPARPPTLPPTLPPREKLTPMPTTTTRTQTERKTDEFGGSDFFVGVAISTLCLSVVIAVVRRARRKASRSRGEGIEVFEVTSLLTDLEFDKIPTDDAAASESKSVELTVRSDVMRSYEVSPAPAFVVARSSMRIKTWSPGMAIAAPMRVIPVGWHISELPFVNAADANRLHRMLVSSSCDLAANDEHRTFVLNLYVQGRGVLLEMVATHILGAESEPVIVLSGRELDSNLAGLMARESAVAPSVTEEEEASGELSAAPSVTEEEEASGELSASLARDDDDSQLSAANPIESGSSTSDAASYSHTASTGTWHTAVHSWDSDTSSARALSQIVRPLRTANTMQARPALDALLESIRTSRKWRRRTARQSAAIRSALTKLRAIGRLLRIARECASLRVLFVEGPAVVPDLATPARVHAMIAAYIGRAPCY